MSTNDLSLNPLYKAEGFCKIGSVIFGLLSLPIRNWQNIHWLLTFAASILGLIRQRGTPQFNREYLNVAVRSEFGGTIMYLLTIVFIRGPGPAFLFPVNLFYAIGIADFVHNGKVGLLLKFEKVRSVSSAIIQFKDQIKRGRAYCEFFLLFYILLMVILRQLTILTLPIYFFFIKMRSITNPVNQSIQQTLQSELISLANSRSLPIAPYITKFFELLGTKSNSN